MPSARSYWSAAPNAECAALLKWWTKRAETKAESIAPMKAAVIATPIRTGTVTAMDLRIRTVAVLAIAARADLDVIAAAAAGNAEGRTVDIEFFSALQHGV